MTGGYHATRLPFDRQRDILWQALWRYRFSRMVRRDDCVLELGAGHGHFINSVESRRRIAVDRWAELPAHLAPGVEHHIGEVTDLGFLDDRSVDFAFASNLFEHLSREDFADVLAALRPKLTPSGTLTIVQPNYRYAYREYFDDYDHKSVYSHISLCDFLSVSGYDVFLVEPRFMPLTVKGRLPIKPLLIRAWLALPVKPIGKQMLVRARPRP